MKPIAVALLCLFLVSGCTSLPRLHSSGSTSLKDCRMVYAHGNWQFVHSIEATPPNGERYTMMGVVQLSSESRSMHCVLLTLEGMVLFEAHHDGQVTILRALPPFDKRGFAHGLMDDLLLIFMAPAHAAQTTGFTQEGRYVCRYPMTGGRIQDIVMADHGWVIRTYSPSLKLERTLTPLSAKSGANTHHPIPRQLGLKTHGMLGYDLVLTLVEAQPLGP